MPDRAETVALLPAMGVLITWIALMPASGGFSQSDQALAGLALAGLLAMAAIGSGRILPAGREVRLALGAFAAFTALSFLSIAWADAPGTAWSTADSLLVTLLAAWVVALAPWRAATAWAFLIVFGVAAAVVCAIALVQALGADDLTSRFQDLRWDQPLDYPNTNSAFALMAALPLLVFAARPTVPALAAAGCQAVATFLGGFALLSESRGSILGGIAAVIAVMAIVPFRWRFVLRAVLLALAMIVVARPVFRVYDAAGSGRVSPALHHAAGVLAVATIAAFLAGLLLGLIQERATLSEPGRRRARLGGWVTAALVALAVVAVAASHASSIRGTLHDQWRSLKHPGIDYAGVPESERDISNRLYDANPRERYDYWRVSLKEFRASPLVGDGAGGFEHTYTIERRYGTLSKYPHNLVMRVLGESGAIGLVLMLALLAAVVAGLWRGRRLFGEADAALIAGVVAVAAYFFAHGQFDWLEAYPVLAGPALAGLIAALVVCERLRRLAALVEGGPVPRARSSHEAAPAWRRAAIGTLVGVTALLAVYSLAAPWLALRYRDRGSKVWRADAAAANRDLDRAASVNPLDPQPLILKGAIAIARHDAPGARDAFRRAQEREDAWLEHFGLSLAAIAAGDRATAVAEIRRARALNRASIPFGPVVAKIERGGRLDALALLREGLAAPQFVTERLK